jgi:hypothetical protein
VKHKKLCLHLNNQFGFRVEGFFFENIAKLGPSSIFGVKPKLDSFSKTFFGQFSIALKFDFELGFELKFS